MCLFATPSLVQAGTDHAYSDSPSGFLVGCSGAGSVDYWCFPLIGMLLFPTTVGAELWLHAR